jgi:hypothetical protein
MWRGKMSDRRRHDVWNWIYDNRIKLSTDVGRDQLIDHCVALGQREAFAAGVERGMAHARGKYPGEEAAWVRWVNGEAAEMHAQPCYYCQPLIDRLRDALRRLADAVDDESNSVTTRTLRELEIAYEVLDGAVTADERGKYLK